VPQLFVGQKFLCSFCLPESDADASATLLWRGQVNQYDYQEPNGSQRGDKTHETKSSAYFARPKNCQSNQHKQKNSNTVVHRCRSLRFPFGFPQPDAGTFAVFFEKDASGFFKRG